MNVSALFVVPWTSKSMKPCGTSVAPGPGWLSVKAWLFQKMLLNSAAGFENLGTPGPVPKTAWNRGSFFSEARPAEWGLPSESSAEPVDTLLAIVLLMMRTFDESSMQERAAEVGGAVVDDHVAPQGDLLLQAVEDEDAAAVVTGVVALEQVAVDIDLAGSVAEASACRRQLGLDRQAAAGVDGLVVVDLVVVDPAGRAEPDMGHAGAVVDAEVRAHDVARDVVGVGPVEDAQAAGLGQATVAQQPVVGDDDVVVVAGVVVRLADADTAGNGPVVVLEHVVGDPRVVDAGLELDATGTFALTRHQPDAVDPGGVEDADRRGGQVVRRVGLATNVTSAPRRIGCAAST